MLFLSLIYILWKSLGGFPLTSLSFGAEFNISNIKSNPIMRIQVAILQRLITLRYSAFMRVLVEKGELHTNKLRYKGRDFLASMLLSSFEHNSYCGKHKQVTNKCLLVNCCWMTSKSSKQGKLFFMLVCKVTSSNLLKFCDRQVITWICLKIPITLLSEFASYCRIISGNILPRVSVSFL